MYNKIYHTACMGEMRYTNRILVRKAEGKKLLGRRIRLKPILKK
jgi:hypothetical protein